MSCQQVPTTPAFNPYPRSVQVGEFEVAIGGGIWVAIRALAVSDQGVSWSGADWEAGAPFSKFETEWTGGGHMEPELARVACRECGDAAQVVQRYP